MGSDAGREWVREDTFQLFLRKRKREGGKEEEELESLYKTDHPHTLTPSSPRKLGLNQTGCLVTVSLLLTHPASYWHFMHLTLHKVDAHFFSFFSFLLATWLVGSQFPNQGLNPGHGSESLES